MILKKILKEIFLKYKNFIFFGEKSLSKLILNLKLIENTNINNYTNLIFRICVNYCLNNGFSFIYESNLDFLEYLLFYINLTIKYNYTTDIYIIKQDFIFNYISYNYGLYTNINKEIKNLEEINIFTYIKSFLNISRLIYKKENNIKNLYIPDETKINIILKELNINIDDIKDKIYKFLITEKKFKLIRRFQDNLNKLEKGKKLIEEIIQKEIKGNEILSYNEFGKIYNNLLDSLINTECIFDNYIFLNESYKYENLLRLPNEFIESYIINKYNNLKDIKEYNLFNIKFKLLTKEEINKIKEMQSSNNCPEILQKQILFVDEKDKINYKVIIENGNLIYIKDKRVIDSYNEYYNIFGELSNKDLNIGVPGKSKLSCFVIDINDNLYIFPFKSYKMHHSFITQGGAINKLAGMIYIKNGKIYYIENRSGHYKTPPKQIDILFEKLKIMSNNNINDLFSYKFDLKRIKFSENILDIIDKEEFGLNLIYINEKNAEIIRERIQKKYFNIKL